MNATLPESPKAAPSAADARRPRRDMFSIDVLLDSNWMRRARRTMRPGKETAAVANLFSARENYRGPDRHWPESVDQDSVKLYCGPGNKPTARPVYPADGAFW